MITVISTVPVSGKRGPQMTLIQSIQKMTNRNFQGKAVTIACNVHKSTPGALTIGKFAQTFGKKPMNYRKFSEKDR